MKEEYRNVEQLREELRRRYAAPDWRPLRLRILQKHGFKCYECGASGTLEIHHLTYERLWHERDEDLIPLCHDCHKQGRYTLEEIRRDKKAIWWVNALWWCISRSWRLFWWLIRKSVKLAWFCVRKIPQVIFYAGLAIAWIVGVVFLIPMLIAKAPEWIKHKIIDHGTE